MNKVQERHDYYAAAQVAAGDDRQERKEADPREEDEPTRAAQEAPDPEDEDMGSPPRKGADDGHDEEDKTPKGKGHRPRANGESTTPLMDGPAKGTDRRFRTPERKPALKRKELIHDEDPDTKNIIRE